MSAMITVPGTDMQAWTHNVSAIELVYRGANPNSAGCPWSESRCPVASIAANGTGGTAVTVAQPCAWNGNNKIHGRQALRVPAFVENVFELLGAKHGHPGEFYLDSAAGELYYVPHAGQDAKTTVGQLPILETLVDASGVSDVSHDGVAFELATWMGPSRGGLGFVDVQGGFCMVCADGDPTCRGHSNAPIGPAGIRETPAALQFTGATNVTFTNCSFSRLGSNAVGFSHGSHRNSVRRCSFDDISASAVAIGTRSDPTEKTTPSQQEINNTVADCVISRTAAEYRGHPGLSIGFSHGTRIEHNEIFNIPYTAVSLGWGWDTFPFTYDGDNHIVGNNIHHHMLLLGDGGAIYTLGPQGNMPFMQSHFKNRSAILPPSTQIGNWIHDGGPPWPVFLPGTNIPGVPGVPAPAPPSFDHDGIGQGHHQPGGLYSDTGTTNWNITGNVVQNVPNWLQGCRNVRIGPNWQDRNWFDAASNLSINQMTKLCPLVGNVQLASDKQADWPAAARAVVAAAGPRDATIL